MMPEMTGEVTAPDAGLAIQRAELMMREGEIAGAIAFSRRGNLESGEAEDAAPQSFRRHT
jgi:hypothetical protein